MSIRGKTKTKNSEQISPYTKLTQTTGPILGRQKPKGRKNSTLKTWKRTPQTQCLKKKNSEKAEKGHTNEEKKTRNTEVQINEEEIGKLPEKELRIMIVKNDQKP